MDAVLLTAEEVDTAAKQSVEYEFHAEWQEPRHFRASAAGR